ncbi:MAG: type II CAAX endopeptidase family protein [Gammaproteobacteria bacterium]
MQPMINRSWMTALCTALLAALVGYLFFASSLKDHLSGLRYPGESAGRMMERHLDFYEGYQQVPAWQRAFFDFLFGQRQDVSRQAIGTYREVLSYFGAHPSGATPWAALNTRARLLVTLAETGRRTQLVQELGRLDDSPEQEVLGDAIRYAYGLGPVDATPEEIRYGVELLPLGWAADRLKLRIAEKAGDARAVAHIERRLDARGARARERLLWLAALIGAVLFAGAWMWWRGGVRARPAGWDAGGPAAPWGLGEGYAVIVRAGLLGLIGLILFSQFAHSYFRPGVLASWATLFASLPMLWLIYRRLLRPYGRRFAQSFGLTLRGVGVLRLSKITLALLALEWCGSLCIAWLGWKVGLEAHWSEGIYERAIFGPWQTTLLGGINAVLWAPLFEEIGFRGLLFPTIRARFGVWPGIAISAVIFASLHLYSAAGFLAVLWSGLVLAWAYERYRSLVPGMIVHAAGNLLAVSTVVLFYR